VSSILAEICFLISKLICGGWYFIDQNYTPLRLPKKKIAKHGQWVIIIIISGKHH